MKITKVTGVALAACMSLTLMTGCTASGSGSITPNDASAPATNDDRDDNDGVSGSVDADFEVSGLNAQAQTALASYHSIDGSFSDSARLNANGSFSTQQLGGIVDDITGNDNDNYSDSDSSTSTGVNVGVGVNVDADTDSDSDGGSTSTGINTGINAGVNTGTSTGSNSTNTGVNVGVGANVDADTDTDNDGGSTSTGINTGVNTGVNVGTNTGSGNGSLNTGIDTSLNADLDSSLNEFRDSSNRLRSDIESSGSIRFTSDNDSIIDSTRLRSNVNGSIDSRNDNDLLNFNDSGILSNDGSINLDSQISSMTQVDASQMNRMRNRGFDTTAGQIRTATNADGSVTTFFGTRSTRGNNNRNILGASRVQGNTDLGTDLMLREDGDGFNTNASRVSSVRANGNTSFMTRATTNFDNGDRIEILEERVLDANGNGTGNGTLTLTDRNGRTQTFDLRTTARADGSLVSTLDNRDDNASDLVLREDASGNASISFMTSNREEQLRSNLDFNAMLDSMSDFDFS